MNFAETKHTAASIHRAENGWVANSQWDGPTYVATSLHELATLVEGPAPTPVVEPVQPTSYSSYADGFNANDLYTVKRYATEGRKIDAIKHLRNCFTVRMNLKEAKDLVDIFCGC